MQHGGMDPQQYYDEFGVGEWDRLEEDPVARLEYENTVSALEAHLPPTGRVLDVGGGPGRYAIWLAEHGYDVQHMDISREQIRIAEDKASEHDVAERVSHHHGDVRELAFDAGSFDAVCCLGGPISHVIDPAERERATRELHRVGTPEAPVIVSVMGRLASVTFGIRHGLDVHPEILPKVADTGDYTEERLADVDGEGWADCHFFRAAEFEALLEAAGLTVDHLIGLEGLASVMQPELEDAPAEGVQAVREVVQLLKDDRCVADMSEHMLAVCRA